MSFNLYSQNYINSNKNDPAQSFETIKVFAVSVYDKNQKIDNLNWYKGDSLRQIYRQLRRFKRGIIKSKPELDYYIDKHVSKKGYIQYSINFYETKNDEQHSKIYIIYEPEASKAKFIQIDNQDVINEMKAEWRGQVGDMPPPPFPPKN